MRKSIALPFKWYVVLYCLALELAEVTFGWTMSIVLVTSTLYISVNIQTLGRTTVSTEKMLVSSVFVSKVDIDYTAGLFFFITISGKAGGGPWVLEHPSSLNILTPRRRSYDIIISGCEFTSNFPGRFAPVANF